VTGAVGCASERDLAVGGAASVAASTFAGVDYVALGHLHGPQRMGERARYAGSTVPFSFSEARHRKSVAVVDLAGPAPQVELVPFPVARPLAMLRGTLDELLADPAHADHERAWVHATVTDPVRPRDAMEALRRRFPHAVVLAFDPQGAGARPEGTYAERLRGLDDTELLSRFVRDVRGSDAEAAELALLGDALTAGRVAELSS
jgi:DNA repair protein SbcD/Mre11